MELENNAYLLCTVMSSYFWLLNTVVSLEAVRSNLLPFLPPIKEMSRWVRGVWWVTHVLLMVSGVVGIWGLAHFGKYCRPGTREVDKCSKLSDTNLNFFLACIGCEAILVGYVFWCLFQAKPEEEQVEGEEQVEEDQQGEEQIVNRVEVKVVV